MRQQEEGWGDGEDIPILLLFLAATDLLCLQTLFRIYNCNHQEKFLININVKREGD